MHRKYIYQRVLRIQFAIGHNFAENKIKKIFINDKKDLFLQRNHTF